MGAASSSQATPAGPPGSFPSTSAVSALGDSDSELTIRVLYLSSGAGKVSLRLARQLVAALRSLPTSSIARLNVLEPADLAAFDTDDLVQPAASTGKGPELALFVLPSYNIASPLDAFLASLREIMYDPRLSRDPLSHRAFAVLGVGNSEYAPSEFCFQAKEADVLLGMMGARRVKSMVTADVARGDAEGAVSELATALGQRWNEIRRQVVEKGWKSVRSAKAAGKEFSREEDDDETTLVEEEVDEGIDTTTAKGRAQLKLLKARRKRENANALGRTAKEDVGEKEDREGDDIEDVGLAMPALKDALQSVSVEEGGSGDVVLNGKKPPSEMITPLTRKALTKQGYALVGSHSGVKTCRWTKSALRGRGFCYKMTLYGINSHRCMEATPSLACANKCTFCWRTHTNPVGTSWRWKMDEAPWLIEESLKEHDRLIKQLRGLPSLIPERFEEARTPKHAALSLVGEPILYPQIERYIDELHKRRISTFLVTNCQFPEPMRDLKNVTQLYLSIDAPTKDALKAIDRPLHKDFYERFLECIDLCRTKRMRTVFRLTLVKDRNDGDVQAYADLIRRGQPDFIEVKGVTFAGFGGTSELTIKNSPFHDEVVNFLQAVVDAVGDDSYGLAAEHRHSCCALGANKKFLVDDVWRTWIDYERYFDLLESGEEFDALDYALPTPDWALVGAPEAGFSPEDTRWYRKGGGPVDE